MRGSEALAHELDEPNFLSLFAGRGSFELE